MPLTRIRMLFFNLLIFSGVFVLLAGGLEIYLRLAGRISDNFLKQDAVLGWVHMPDKEGWSVTKEYRVPVKINRFGLVGPEITLEKPVDTLRIAFLGDSLTEAFQVNPEDAFPRLVAKRLNDLEKDKKVEVLNFGVTSYGTVKELYVLENEVLKFKPDLVVLGFFGGNDFADNLSENINPEARFTTWQKIKNWKKLWWRNHSTAYRWLLEKKARLIFLTGQTTAGSRAVFSSKFSEIANEEIAKTEQYLQKIKNTTNQYQIPLLVLILPNKEQVYESLRAPEEQSLDWEKPHKILKEWFEREKIAYLDVLPLFQSWSMLNPKGLAFFKLDGHPNETGHWLIAKGLLEYLQKNNYGR